MNLNTVWVPASILAAGLIMASPVVVLADSGVDAEGASRPNAGDLLEKAARLQDAGCASDGPLESLECAWVPSIIADLDGIGEYLAAAVTCSSLQGRGMLVDGALVSCASVEARLGAVQAAVRYLDRYVAASTDDSDRMNRCLESAALFVDRTRYRAAGPYFECAASLAQAVAPERVVSVTRSVFVNCLDAGDAACASRVAPRINDPMWVAREYLDRDMPRLALEPVRRMAADGVTTIEELGVAVAVYSAAGLPADAAAAAASCLERCPGADVLSVSAAMSRGGLAAEAARFAQRNRARFADGTTADFDIGFLWLQAGEADKAVSMLTAWAVPAPGAAVDGIDYRARQVRVEKRLLAEGQYAVAADFGAVARKAGGTFLPEIGVDMVSALLKAGKEDEALPAAGELLDGNQACGALRYRLAALFFGAGEFDSCVSIIAPCGAGPIPVDEDPLLPARVHLLRARLVRSGYLSGDLESEIVSAFRAAGTDRDIVEAVDRFAAGAGAGPRVELVAAESVVGLGPNDPVALARLGDARVATGDESGAVEAYDRAVKAQDTGSEVLSAAVDRLLGAGFLNGAIVLLRARAASGDVSPALASRLGMACLQSGDGECVAAFVDRFLAGPVSDEVNYFELADSLMSSGWIGLAQRTLDVASRAYPWDRTGREKWLRGRLALMAGDEDKASGYYRQALQAAPVKGLVLMAITLDYARVGNIGGSLRWLKDGMTDSQAAVRAQIFPTWVDTLRRVGRASEISLEPLRDVEIDSIEDWGRSIDLLVASGRVDLAIELVQRIRDNVPASDLGPLLVRQTVMHCMAGDRDAAAATASAACAWAVSFGGDFCVEAAAALAGAGLGAESVKALGGFGTAPVSGLTSSGIATLVLMNLLENGVNAAFNAASLVTPAVFEEKTSLSGMWPLLQATAGVSDWDSFITLLAARPDLDTDGHVHLDAALAALAAGDSLRGRRSLARYLASPAGDTMTAVRELISEGWFQEAETALRAAPDAFWAGVDDRGIARLAASFLVRGRPDGAEWLYSRYVSGNNGSSQARQTVAGVRHFGGDWRAAAAELSAMPDSSLGPDARLILGTALWRGGDREGAMEQFRKLARSGNQDEPLEPAQYGVMGMLDSEAGASRELSEIMGLISGRSEVEDDMRMSEAIVNLAVGDDQHRGKAREILFSVLRHHRSVTVARGAIDPLNVRDFVLAEARTGTAGDLAVKALGIRGAAFAQTAMFAACLAGDEATFKAAGERLFTGRPADGKGDRFADPADLLAAAGISFACGRFDDAADFAVRYVGGGHVDSDGMSEAITIAVKASAAAGRRNPLTPARIRGLTDDRLLQTSFVATAASTAGDWRSVFDAYESVRAEMPGEQSLVMESISAWISSGQGDGLARYAFDLVRTLPDPGSAYPLAFRLISSSFRYDDAAGFARLVADALPGSIQARADLFAALLNVGDENGAIDIARSLLASRKSPSATALGLISTAARARRIPVVLALAGDIAADGSGAFDRTLPPDLVEDALDTVQVLDASLPGSPQTEGFLEQAFSWARDHDYFCAAAVRSLTDGWHESGDMYVRNVSRLFADGRCPAGETSDRLADTVAALSGGAGVIQGFKATWSIDDLRTLVRAAVFTAVLQGRTSDALSWLDGASIPGFTAAETLQTMIETTAFLSDRPALPQDDIRRIGAFGLKLLRDNVAGDGRYAMSEATLLVLALGVEEFGKFMSREIALDPSSEHNRNMLAYMVSVRGKDKAAFRKAAPMAVTLAGADRGGYMETEAWGSFVYGAKGRAIEMQKAAAAHWSTADFATGLPECWNHYATMLDDAGRIPEATEFYRRSVLSSEGWDWHGILSARRLARLNYFQPGAGD